MIKQIGDTVFDKIFGADNETLVLLYPVDIDTALSMEVNSEYDWIIVQSEDTYCLLNVADRKILPEHTISFQNLRNYNGVSWFQVYNRVLTTSALGGLDKVIKLSITNSDSELQAVLGMALSELDEMRLTLHRNINHALLHIESNEQIPLYDRVKYKVQASNAWFKAVKYLKKVDLLVENTEVTAIVNGVSGMDIEHLNNLNADLMEYIRYFQQQNTDDLYI